ncbi:MAG: hypothetical protein ACPGUV_03580 [Polyangiales bacterium]
MDTPAWALRAAQVARSTDPESGYSVLRGGPRPLHDLCTLLGLASLVLAGFIAADTWRFVTLLRQARSAVQPAVQLQLFLLLLLWPALVVRALHALHRIVQVLLRRQVALVLAPEGAALLRRGKLCWAVPRPDILGACELAHWGPVGHAAWNPVALVLDPQRAGRLARQLPAVLAARPAAVVEALMRWRGPDAYPALQPASGASASTPELRFAALWADSSEGSVLRLGRGWWRRVPVLSLVLAVVLLITQPPLPAFLGRMGVWPVVILLLWLPLSWWLRLHRRLSPLEGIVWALDPHGLLRRHAGGVQAQGWQDLGPVQLSAERRWSLFGRGQRGTRLTLDFGDASTWSTGSDWLADPPEAVAFYLKRIKAQRPSVAP